MSFYFHFKNYLTFIRPQKFSILSKFEKLKK